MNKITEIVLAVLMTVSLIIVLAVSACAAEISDRAMTIADADGSGALTSADAAIVLQKVLNNNYQIPDGSLDILVGDVDGDGILTSADVAVIIQKVLNYDYVMPIERIADAPQEDEVRIKVTVGDTVGYITDLQDNSTANTFLEMLPYSTRMHDLDGREYWFSHNLPYDDESVQHTYAIGEFTYWCGGWVTGYYDVNEDTVIEDGSVVIGTMDNTLVQTFRNAAGKSVEVSFEIAADN